jgi:hypothetical protein
VSRIFGPAGALLSNCIECPINVRDSPKPKDRNRASPSKNDRKTPHTPFRHILTALPLHATRALQFCRRTGMMPLGFLEAWPMGNILQPDASAD